MKKFTSIEYLRALSMLYIVGYWHLFDYSSASLGHGHPFTTYVTQVVLALFVFISGYLLGGENTRKMSAMQFYKRRLLRIYPLYALAVGIFFLYGINDGFTSIKALFGVSMYMQPTPLTLWFITMLVLFYLVTPVLLRLVDNLALYAATVAAVLVATIGAQRLFNSVDPDILLYFPSFCLGIYCANYGLRTRLLNGISASVGLVAAVALAFVQFPLETLQYLAKIPLVGAAAYLIFRVCYENERSFPKVRVISFFSYSSFAMYLFHRPVYTTLQSVWFPENPWLQVAYLGSVGLVTATLVAWSLQKLYDRLYNNAHFRTAPVKATV